MATEIYVNGERVTHGEIEAALQKCGLTEPPELRFWKDEAERWRNHANRWFWAFFSVAIVGACFAAAWFDLWSRQ